MIRTLPVALLLNAPLLFGQVVPPEQPGPEAQRHASGLVSVTLRPGQGPLPQPMDLVRVHFAAWAEGGKLIEDTRKRGEPVTLWQDRLMKGMAEAIQAMRPGETRRLWIPEALAFAGAPGRPKGPLRMEVELLEIEAPPSVPPSDVTAPPADAKATPTGLRYRILRPGDGKAHPGKRSQVTVHYSGWTTDGKLFDSSVMRRSPETFSANEVIPGWTEGLQLLSAGEKARFWIPEGLAYKGKRGKPAGMLVFDIEVLAFFEK